MSPPTKACPRCQAVQPAHVPLCLRAGCGYQFPPLLPPLLAPPGPAAPPRAGWNWRWVGGLALALLLAPCVLGVPLGLIGRPVPVVLPEPLPQPGPATFRIHAADVRGRDAAGHVTRMRCMLCDGTGKAFHTGPVPPGGRPTLPFTFDREIVCPNCGGSGSAPVTGVKDPVVVVPDNEPTDYVPQG